jgi:2,3-bisphosphoglycerate-independent phosphoglycerate mutase
MGAGRVFAQGAKLVNDALASRRLFQGKCWMHLIGNPEQPGLALQQQTSSRSVHFLGLLSDGNVHSHINHLLQLIDECAHVGVQRVYVHTLMDGRDVEKDSGLKYIDMLEEKLDMYNNSEERKYEIASGGGRMKITMDRYEADWNMVLL